MRTLIVTLSLAAVAACGGSQPQPAAPAAAAEKTIFTDAPAYASQPVAASAASAHAAKKQAAPNLSTACLSCHKAGGTAPQFVIAGTVYADAAGTKGAPDVEIRVADASGNGTSVHSDADGNFWVKGTTAFAGPGHAGARDATLTKTMHQPITTGDCNSCHNSDLPLLLKH